MLLNYSISVEAVAPSQDFHPSFANEQHSNVIRVVRIEYWHPGIQKLSFFGKKVK
jgi:hypothetical protein